MQQIEGVGEEDVDRPLDLVTGFTRRSIVSQTGPAPGSAETVSAGRNG